MNESRHIVNSEAVTAKNRRPLRPSDLEAFGGYTQSHRGPGPGRRAMHSWSAAQADKGESFGNLLGIPASFLAAIEIPLSNNQAALRALARSLPTSASHPVSRAFAISGASGHS
jgi:hypothetical protein